MVRKAWSRRPGFFLEPDPVLENTNLAAKRQETTIQQTASFAVPFSELLRGLL